MVLPIIKNVNLYSCRIPNSISNIIHDNLCKMVLLMTSSRVSFKENNTFSFVMNSINLITLVLLIPNLTSFRNSISLLALITPSNPDSLVIKFKVNYSDFLLE